MLKTHYEKVKYVIENSSDEQLRDIGIDQKTISRLREDISYIQEVKLSTAYTLYHKYFSEWATVIGIDIGTGNYLSASDASMERTYTDTSDELARIIKKYRARLKQKKFDNNEAEKKFARGIKKHINKVVKEIMEIYPSPRVLVVGKGSGDGISESMFGRIFVYTHKSLLKYSDKFDDIVLVDEAYTSVKCPECSFVHKKNRKYNNHFKCRSCGYENEDDNIVASYNIAQEFLKII